MSFWIPARELSIVWGEDTRYWQWTHILSFRSDVAELIKVCWMDISGRINVRKLNVKTCYAAFLVFKLDVRSKELEKATASVRFAKEICEGCSHEGYTVLVVAKTDSTGRFPQKRGDGWMEIKLGEFFNDLGDDGEVEMRLIETDGHKWKTGLVVRGIEIRPY